MKVYLDLLSHILRSGATKMDRTGTGTLSVFGHQMRFDLQAGFPLVTTKKLHWKSVVHELLWMLNGDTNIEYLNNNGVTIWDEWADENGDLGPIYGYQWRLWARSADGGHIDQISRAVSLLRQNPDSRRIIVSAWNVSDLGKMALEPCHILFQLYVHDRRLSCQVYQRSGDVFLGVPFNIASYALLTHMFANQCDLLLGDLIWTCGDAHLYLNHIEQAKQQLSREPMKAPILRIYKKPRNIFSYKPEDFNLIGYQHHPAISALVSV